MVKIRHLELKREVRKAKNMSKNDRAERNPKFEMKSLARYFRPGNEFRRDKFTPQELVACAFVRRIGRTGGVSLRKLFDQTNIPITILPSDDAGLRNIVVGQVPDDKVEELSSAASMRAVGFEEGDITYLSQWLQKVETAKAQPKIEGDNHRYEIWKFLNQPEIMKEVAQKLEGQWNVKRLADHLAKKHGMAIREYHLRRLIGPKAHLPEFIKKVLGPETDREK